MKASRKLIIRVFKKACTPFKGRGLGKIPGIMRIYTFIVKLLLPDELILVEIDGRKLYLDLSSKAVDLPLFLNGVWEEGTTRLFKEIIDKGMCVVDAGAHIGYFTLLAADLVGKEGKVFAFEPYPSNYAMLVKNIKINGYENIIPVRKAISNKTGITRLYLSPESKAGHSLISPRGFNRDSIIIEETSLDEYFKIKNKNIPIDVIKMDIEGGEMAALQGMTEIIKKNINLKIIAEFGSSGLLTPREFLNMLIELGFKLSIIGEERCIESSVDDLMEIYEKRDTNTAKLVVNLFCER